MIESPVTETSACSLTRDPRSDGEQVALAARRTSAHSEAVVERFRLFYRTARDGGVVLHYVEYLYTQSRIIFHFGYDWPGQKGLHRGFVVE